MLKKLNSQDAALREAILAKLMGQLEGHDHDMRKSKLSAMSRGGEVGQTMSLPGSAMETSGGMPSGVEIPMAAPKAKKKPVAGEHQELPEGAFPKTKLMADGGEVDGDAPEGDEDSNAMEALKGESPASFGAGDSTEGDATEAAGDPSDEADDAEPSADDIKKKLRMML